MVQVVLEIAEKLKAFADARVADGEFESTSDYVSDLMRRDREAEEDIEWLQNELDKGAASPVSPGTPTEIVARIISESRARRAA